MPSSTSPTTAASSPRALRWAGWLLAVLLCLGVFGMYTAPDFMVMLADQVWACF